MQLFRQAHKQHKWSSRAASTWTTGLQSRTAVYARARESKERQRVARHTSLCAVSPLCANRCCCVLQVSLLSSLAAHVHSLDGAPSHTRSFTTTCAAPAAAASTGSGGSTSSSALGWDLTPWSEERIAARKAELEPADRSVVNGGTERAFTGR